MVDLVEVTELFGVARSLRDAGNIDHANIVADALDEIVSLRRRLEDAQAENRRLHAIELQSAPTRGAHW